MNKGLMFILLLVSPILIVLIVLGFLFMMIFMGGDTGDQLEDLYGRDSNLGAYCSPTGEMDLELANSKLAGGALEGKAHLFQEIADEFGVDPVFMIAISALETGWGKSDIVNERNNPGGLIIDNVFHTFDTLKDGMRSLGKTVHTLVIEEGRTDIHDFASRYASVDDPRDVKGENALWPDNVISIATSLGGFTMNCVPLESSGVTESVDMGEYTVEIKGGHAWMTPFTKYLTYGVGPRWGKQHNGLDISWPGIANTPVVSMLGGKVIQVNTGCPRGCLSTGGCTTYTCGTGYGNYVYVDHGGGMVTRYAHLKDVHVYVGQKVQVGQLLGTVGSSGHSSNDHLHFEIRVNGNVIDPEALLSKKGFVMPSAR